MELSQHLELKQTLTPQQILLSTLLQLPSLALELRIKTELEMNPLLELEDDIEELDNPEEESEVDEPEIDLDDYFQNDGYEAKEYYDKSNEEMEVQNAYTPSLAEELLEQIATLHMDADSRVIMEEMIWNIDERGYLTMELEIIAEKFEVDLKSIEKLHGKLMQLDPIGIGARTLQECLLVQAEREYPQTPAHFIIRDYFEEFANKRFERILRKLHLTRSGLREAEEMISHLNPKPGDGYLDPRTNYVTPDFYISEQDGDFIVTLNDSFIPDLRISGSYKNMISNQKSLDTDTKVFLKKKVESAKWFINSIQMRRITMLKVINSIIEHQREFFLKGQDYLRPMVLRDIAEDISMDISTISRVTSGKYAQTDWGTFELRYFFSEGIEAEDGENISTRRIKERLRVIIEEENKSRPISDEAISKLLQTEGFPIARRTVAKYREQLNIPVARLRREI
ncbi:MAG: RNA polymerase factor sigma-54 [Candidatus Marinimicrobia bacterium]|nr:RNA polymerase factor sigma-54 [Candidatus Neomarinimicrobiota bacterium]MCF7851550.1 RNA polymerase factor sigma-54 [Candidatus Neomarinimicrobiota bacterium]MCF7905275.1 RNA polymerase factor sigma-54 [Candidatus Neomarinimicrobiota bacterium]